MHDSIFQRFRRLFWSKAQRRHHLVGSAQDWQQKRQFQFEFLLRAGLEPHHTLLDIGCGTLRGGIPLINYLNQGAYVGTETRHEALQAAEEELAEAGLFEKAPKLLLPEEFSLIESEQFDFVWAFSVLFHLHPPELTKMLTFMREHMHTNSIGFANVSLGAFRQSTWREFPYYTRDFEWYASLFSDHEFKLENLGSLDSLGHKSGHVQQDRQVMLKLWL